MPTLASSLVSPLLPAFIPASRAGEDFINRSLLDSLDAQADAEPVSSSDSEAVGSLSAPSSIGSPSAPFHIGMSLHHPRSPSPQMLQNHINSPHINEYSHFMYNSVQEDPDVRKQRSKNSFAAYRSPPFNAYNGNPRQAPSNFVQSYSSDLYSQHIDTLSPNRFDLGEEAQTYVGIDQYGNNETGSMLLQSPPAPAPQPQQPPYSHAPYLAGLTHMQSQQVTYGPHLPGPLNQPSTATATMPTNNGTTQSGSQQQEEISTIFVVGFPDDMQVGINLINLNSIHLTHSP